MDSFSLFYRDTRERLYAYLLRMTGDPALSADLMQESFVRYLKRYGRDSGSRPLLYTIARNAALDSLRRQSAQGLDPENHQAPGNSPEQQVMAGEALHGVLKAMASLGPQDREMLALVATADLTYREIADMLKIGEGTVKVRVHRARTRLREILASGGN